jgi:glycosyltransferase involved in cell wall biosynthesis
MADMKRIRVLQIVSGLSVEGSTGGSGRFVIELARALDQAEFEPMVAAIWDYHVGFEQKWAEQLAAAGVRNVIAADWDEAAPYRSCVRSLQALQGQRDFAADILHSHGEFTDLAAIYLRRPLRARRIIRTVHSALEWSKRPYYGRLFANLCYPLAFDREVAVSQRATDNLNLRRLARLRGRQAQCIYNALNFRRFDAVRADRAAARVALGLPPHAPVIGTVGRLVAVKGYRYLLAALPAVLAQQPEAHLVIVGDGVEGPALQAQAQTLGIAARVHFTGARADVEMLLGTFDLFASTSLVEGLPTVVLESMAARVPVVVSAVPGNLELISDGETGIVTPVADPPALATAIVAALAEPERMRRLAATAYRQARANFSIEAIADRYAVLYRELLDRHPVGGAGGQGAAVQS